MSIVNITIANAGITQAVVSTSNPNVNVQVTTPPQINVQISGAVINQGTYFPIVGETPTGLVNGSNATYTTAFEFVPETVELFINGIAQKKVTNYQTSGNSTILINDSPLTGDVILVNYQKLYS